MRKIKNREERPDPAQLPRHIGIVLDGNGRWARKRGLPRTAGHIAGFSDATRKVIYHCRDIGIRYVTLYAFSTENWRRGEKEVTGIFGLMERFLNEVIDKAETERSRVKFLGDLQRLPEKLRRLIDRAQQATAGFESHQLNICFNYGGRNEVTRAVQRLAADCKAGELDSNDIDESVVERYLDTAGIPDPELIIRPGGEYRLSNFLMWQSVYSELYFTDTLWPDFTSSEIDRAICFYQKRKRRFGG